MGGIARLEVIFEREINAFPNRDIRSHYLEGSMILSADSQAYFLYFTSKSAQYSEKGSIKSRAGDSYTQELTVKTPRNRPLLRTFIERLRNNNVAIVFQDRNGHFLFLRNMRLVPTISSGTRGSYNGTTFQFSGASILPAGFWKWVENPYIQASMPCPAELATDNSEPTPPTISATTYTHCQDTLANIWTINHNLDSEILRPELRMPDGRDFYTADLVKNVFFPDHNTVVIHFKLNVKGCAMVTAFTGASCQC